jgi:hypothetical protein
MVGYQSFGGLCLQGEEVVMALLPQNYTVPQPSEDGGSKVVRNVGILPHHCTISERNEDGGSEVLRNLKSSF